MICEIHRLSRFRVTGLVLEAAARDDRPFHQHIAGPDVHQAADVAASRKSGETPRAGPHLRRINCTAG